MAEENEEYDFDQLLEAEPEPEMEEQEEVPQEAPKKAKKTITEKQRSARRENAKKASTARLSRPKAKQYTVEEEESDEEPEPPRKRRLAPREDDRYSQLERQVMQLTAQVKAKKRPATVVNVNAPAPVAQNPQANAIRSKTLMRF
jgi:hypothetical protein